MTGKATEQEKAPVTSEEAKKAGDIQVKVGNNTNELINDCHGGCRCSTCSGSTAYRTEAG